MPGTKVGIIDKSTWGPGPWQSEPDRVEWRLGPFYAAVNRSTIYGSLNGYVGVPPGHPWHGKSHEEVHELSPQIDVHGGLSYSSDYGPVPGLSPPPGFWLVGFDCGRSGDLSPGMVTRTADHFRQSLEIMRLMQVNLGANLGVVVDPVVDEAGGSPLFGVYRDLPYVTVNVFALASHAGPVIARRFLPLGPNLCDGVARWHDAPVPDPTGAALIRAYVYHAPGGEDLGPLADWLSEHAAALGLSGGTPDALHAEVLNWDRRPDPKP